MKLSIFVFIFLISRLLVAQVPLFEDSIFEVGSQWTWSYSERLSEGEGWKSPYLYETYRVVKRNGSEVTIEMASDDEEMGAFEAHHKFVADISECKAKGLKLSKFNRWKIRFYTKSINGEWILLSSSHKGLAFTEKFNCFSGQFSVDEKSVWKDGEELTLKQWIGFPVKSWYLQENSPLAGVAFQRSAGRYRMELVSWRLSR